MLGRYRKTLVGSASVLAIAAAAPAFAADAQQQAQPVSGIEEITVTARRVEENIQRVPIAITAFTPEKLAGQDVKDIWTLTKSIGGINICCAPGDTAYIFIRGLGNGSPTYFADVPVTSTGFANFFDIQNVQVLKGPQGTLFGLSSNAGAFVFEPRRPGATLGGFLTVSGGNYGRRSIEGGLDIPIVEDKVLFRMAAQSFYRNGYIIDIRNNRDLANQNFYILRPSLTLKITEDLENYTLFQYVKSKSNGPANVFVLNDFNFAKFPAGHPQAGQPQVGIVGIQGFFSGGTNAAFDALRDQALATQIKLGPYKVDGFSNGCATPLGPVNGPSFIANLNYPRVACPFRWERNYFLTNTTTWNFMDDWSVKNIIGLSRTKSFQQPLSVSGSPLLVFDFGSAKNNTPTTGDPTWSEEIQVHGKMFDVLDLVVGTFHTAAYSYPKTVYALVFGNFESAVRTKTSSYDHSVYGQGNLDLNDMLEGLSATAGYRYSWDKTASQSWNLDPATLRVLPGGVVGGPNSPAGLAKFSQGSYTIGFQYQYTPDTMFYVTNAKGYSSGGLQNVVGFESFSPDALNNLEGGVKSTFELAGVTARVNASYFYGWYSNVKVSVTSAVTNSVTGAQNLVVVTQNAAAAHVQGLDADITIVPTDYLELGGFVAYTRDKYTRYPSKREFPLGSGIFQDIDLSGTPFSFTARVKYNLRGTYHFPLDQAKWGDISVTGNYTHTGTLYNVAKPFFPVDPTNPNTGLVCFHTRTIANGYGPLSADGKRVPVDCNPPYHNLDLNLDWRDILGHSGLDASFIVTNVTKNTQNDGGCYCDVALGVTAPIPQVPRMFVVQLKYSF